MKATNNNTDTLFMEIFVELLAIAKTYFQELFKNEKPSVYTLKDIYTYIESCESLEAKQGKAERLTDKEREQAIKYYTKDNVKFVTWKYNAGVPCFYLNKSVDIVNVLLLNDSKKLQGFFCKGYFVKNILKKNKKKFLPGNFYQFLYKLVYVGYKIENGERLKMYQLKEVAYFESV